MTAATRCIHYSSGYKYQLRASYAVLLPEIAHAEREPVTTDWLELDPDGTLRVRAGYAWDGASGPTIDTKSSMRASLLHDACYQLIRKGLLDHSFRPVVDRMFRRICKEDGMWSVRAQLWYLGVRIFADPATDPASEAPDESAGCGCES